jgi:hypothetical protein
MILEFERKGNFAIPCASVSLWRRVDDELTVFLVGGRSFAFYDDEALTIEKQLRTFYETGPNTRRKLSARRSGKSTKTDRENS